MSPVTRGHLEKAARAVRAARLLLDDGHPDFAASRAYYALLYVAGALLREEDLRLAEHLDLYGQVRERFGRSRVIEPCFYEALQTGGSVRQRADYLGDDAVTVDEAVELIASAQASLAAAYRQLDHRSASDRAA